MLWIAAGGFLIVAVGIAISPFRNARLDDLPPNVQSVP
jgi:hypothetical protein